MGKYKDPRMVTEKSLTNETHARLSVQRECSELGKKLRAEQRHHGSDLCQQVTNSGLNVQEEVAAMQKSLVQIEVYCGQSGVYLTDDLKTARDALIKGIQDYHTQVDRLLKNERERVRKGYAVYV